MASSRIRTCSVTPAAMRCRTEATIPGHFRRTLGTKTFNTRYGILSYHRLGSKTFGENDGRIDEQSLSDPPTEEPPIEISPEADAAMAELVKIFSDPNLPTKPRFRCGVDGPDEFDVMFESIMEEQFGDSEYKQWVRRLYELGFIPRLPDEWK